MKIINKEIRVGDCVMLKDLNTLKGFYVSKGLNISAIVEKKYFGKKFIVVKIIDASNYKFLLTMVDEFKKTYQVESIDENERIHLYDFEVIKIF